MNDFKLLGGFGNRQTDEQTSVVVESLLRLKKCDLAEFSVVELISTV